MYLTEHVPTISKISRNLIISSKKFREVILAFLIAILLHAFFRKGTWASAEIFPNKNFFI